MLVGEHWMYAYASVIGNSHTLDSKPCQDHCRVEHYEGFSIAVVCDGAGSCVHSDIGSKATTELAVYRFQEAISDLAWDGEKERPTLEGWKEVAKKTLLDVRNDLEEFASHEGLEFKSLSCTVIVAIRLMDALLLTHIGDGRAGYCNANDEWFPLMTPFRGKEANETVFITSDIWDAGVLDTYLESVLIQEEIKAFCLLTDGCEKASFECNLFDSEKGTFYDPNRPYKEFFHKNVTTNLPAFWSLGMTQMEINQRWAEFLTSGNARLKMEPDDKTMVLAVRKANQTISLDGATGTA